MTFLAGTALGAEWTPTASLGLGAVLSSNASVGGVAGTATAGGVPVAGAGGRAGASDLILLTSPVLGLKGAGDRLKLDVLYSPVIRGFLNDSNPDRIINNLRGNATLEAVDNLLFLEGLATIIQTEISPFGGGVNDPALANRNRTESRTLGVAPYLNGRLPGGAQYNLRYDYRQTHLSTSALADSTFNEVSATLGGQAQSFAVPAAELRYSTREVGGTQVSESTIARLRGTLNVGPDFVPFASVGYEDNQYRFQQITGTTYGAGFRWAPTPRTSVVANLEKRFFGSSYTVDADHRMSRMSFSFNASRSEQVLPGLFGQTVSRAVDTRSLLDQALQSTIADPVARQSEVERLMVLRGLPDQLVGTQSLLSTRVNLVTSIQPSFTLLGVRNSITASVFRRETRPLTVSLATGLPDPFAATSAIVRQGLTLSASHQISPRTTLTADVTLARTSGTATVAGGTSPESRQQLFRLNASHSLNSRTSVSAGLRWQRFDSNQANDFQENALLVNVNHSFY